MAGISDVTSGNGGADLTDALGRIFSEIQAVNSVFASVSLPVSITTQGTFLNQVYIGHVPAGRRCAAALAGQPEAIQARHPEQPVEDTGRR